MTTYQIVTFRNGKCEPHRQLHAQSQQKKHWDKV